MTKKKGDERASGGQRQTSNIWAVDHWNPTNDELRLSKGG
jgi:hypothetical protein